MASASELALYAHLSDVVSLDALLRSGLPADAIPTDELRLVYVWALDYYEQSRRMQAPTEAAIREQFGDALADAEISWDGTEPESIHWVIERLRGQHAYFLGEQWSRQWVQHFASQEPGDRVAAMLRGADDLYQLALRLQARTHNVGAVTGLSDSLADYRRRVALGQSVDGMRLHLGPVDEFLHGIHAGELALLAAGPKLGKSAVLAHVALKEALLAGRQTCLFTLENSVQMTFDRMVCFGAAVPYTAWQTATATEEQMQRVSDLQVRVDQAVGEERLRVIRPPFGERTASQIVHTARNHECDSLLIDQLSHIEHPNPGRKAKTEIVGEILYSLQDLITERNLMSCLTAHQINREGVKAAEKEDSLQMYHLADSAVTERAPSLVLGLFRNADEREAGYARLKVLASRRTDIEEWPLVLRIGDGVFDVFRPAVTV